MTIYHLGTISFKYNIDISSLYVANVISNRYLSFRCINIQLGLCFFPPNKLRIVGLSVRFHWKQLLVDGSSGTEAKRWFVVGHKTKTMIRKEAEMLGMAEGNCRVLCWLVTLSNPFTVCNHWTSLFIVQYWLEQLFTQQWNLVIIYWPPCRWEV